MASALSSLGLHPLIGKLPSNHAREIIAGGSLGTAQTIERMQELVTLGKRDQRLRTLAGKLIQSCTPKDYYCYAEQCFLFCRDRIKYAYDPNGVELLEHPWRIVEIGIADCDSIVILLATLCESLGFPCRFVTIKADKQRPGDYSHVFLEVKIPKRGWIGADATQPGRPFGWQPGPEFPRKTWTASKDDSEDKDADAMGEFGSIAWNPGAGLGDFSDIPGVADTPGVLSEKPWEFRTEAALITATPEQLELNALEGRPAGLPTGAAQQDFWLPSDLPTKIDEMPEVAPQLLVRPRMGDFSMNNIPKWVWIVGGAALVWYLMKRK